MMSACIFNKNKAEQTKATLCNAVQVDLPAQLSVDLVHCERAAQQAVAESNGGLRLLQAELFTTAYFDNLAAEVNEVLQVCCCSMHVHQTKSSFSHHSALIPVWAVNSIHSCCQVEAMPHAFAFMSENCTYKMSQHNTLAA